MAKAALTISDPDLSGSLSSVVRPYFDVAS